METDQKKCDRRIVTLKRSIREKMLGQPEFSVLDMLRSEHDLTEALKSYRFVLAPIVSELAAGYANYHIDHERIVTNRNCGVYVH